MKQIVDIAAALRVAEVSDAHALRLHAPDDQLAAQQRQQIDRQAGVVERGEFVRLADFADAQLRQPDRESREHRQLDRAVDRQRAIAMRLDPVDRHALDWHGAGRAGLVRAGLCR